MIENPFESITAEPLEAIVPKGAPPSAVKAYRCPKCNAVFEENNYEALDVYFGVDLVWCKCCTSYSHSTLDEDSYENAWNCGNGCFNHDKGACPDDNSIIETGWMCSNGCLHSSEFSAMNCKRQGEQ